MAQGTVKRFEAANSSGVLLLDDGQEIALDRGSIRGSEIRYLRLGQRVAFDILEEDGRRVARDLHIVTFP